MTTSRIPPTRIVLAVLISGTLSFFPTIIYCYRGQLEMNARMGCVSSLEQIEGAKIEWMREHHKSTNDIPTWSDLVGPDAYLSDILKCPNGGTYTIGRMSEPPTCSIAKDNDYYKQTSERSRTRTNAYEQLIKPTNTD